MSNSLEQLKATGTVSTSSFLARIYPAIMSLPLVAATIASRLNGY
jgi:hypothetical protein